MANGLVDPSTARVSQCLNSGWRFHRGAADDAHAGAFDDGAWQRVGLPHTFDLPYFRTPEFYVGEGWYRRVIELAEADLSRDISIEFEGVFQVADVYLNGAKVGSHRGGYTPFAIDLSKHARAGSNVLAVQVDNLWNAQLAPRAGEHIFSGGIYRDVALVITDRLRIVPNGVTITTPHVSADRAELLVEVTVSNNHARERSMNVAAEVIAPDGQVIATLSTSAELDAGATATLQMLHTIDSPALWHPETPNLYTLRVRCHDTDGNVIDEVDERFGLRWFEWTADRGFFLNGQSLYLRGANAHQDHAGWGIAITRSAIRRDAQLIKDAGFNFLRGSHYPHHRELARACDEIGLIYLPENCFWGKGGFGPEGYWNASAYPANLEDGPAFEKHCRETMRELIASHRNHASIVGWSLSNEAFFSFHIDRVRSLLKQLADDVHQLDPTRPAIVGGAQRGEVDHLGDVAAYNGDGARLFIDPGVPNLVSEYGAISKPHDAFDPFHGDLQPDRYPWRSGEAIWAGFDYGTIAGKQGLKGIVDHYRLPKWSWHWYREHNLGITRPPLPKMGEATGLTLTSDRPRIERADGTDDVQLIVTVVDAAGERVANCPPVTLTVESGPGELPTGRTMTFDAEGDIRITLGQAAIAMRAYHAGVTIVRASSPGLTDATIEIESLGDTPFEGDRNDDRPYFPPAPSDASLAANRNAVNVARDRPSRASSEHRDHPARLANDADGVTAWQASADDREPWWQLDLEGFYQLASCQIVFPTDGNWRFVMSTSVDGKTWADAIDRTQTNNAKAVRNDIFSPGTVARYVRLRYTHVPPGQTAGLAEMALLGILSLR